MIRQDKDIEQQVCFRKSYTTDAAIHLGREAGKVIQNSFFLHCKRENLGSDEYSLLKLYEPKNSEILFNIGIF